MLRERQLALAASQRDDYAKIASTHEIEAPRWGAGEWARKVWRDRRYGGHPPENLADLHRDFAPFAEKHVLLVIDLKLLGGWNLCLVKTPAHRFYQPAAPDSEDGVGRWRDENSPMAWRLTLDVLHPKSPSHLQFVEVLKVHKRVGAGDHRAEQAALPASLQHRDGGPA